MKKIVLLITLLCATLTSNAQDFAGVTTADTFHLMNSVAHIQNDSEMNIWVGYKLDTKNGWIPKVASWDGANLKIYSQADGLEFGVVRAVFPSKAGHVWLATATGVRKLMQDGKYTDYPLPQAGDGFRIIDDGQWTRMVEDGAGVLYCNTSLFAQKDIYNESFNTLKQPEVWKLENGYWKKSELKGADNSIGYNFYSDPEGGIITSYFDISLGSSGNKLLIINETTNKEEDYQFKDFLEGRVSVLSSTLAADKNKILVSYKPLDAGKLYEGFSIINRDTKSWQHFGSSAFQASYPDLSFTPIPSAVRLENGTYFPESNWASKITPALGEGFWLSMERDYKEDWLIEQGGGLLYFDGEEKFIRYSPGTHEGIVPFRPGKELPHSSDGRDFNKVTWGFGTGVAYNKNGDLFVGSLFGGLWVIPKDVLPQSTTASVVEESNSKGFLIIPNMVTAGEPLKVALPFEFRGDISAISITDQTGRTISTYSSEQLTATMKLNINTEGFAHGIYYVNMTIDNVSRTEKFIIK